MSGSIKSLTGAMTDKGAMSGELFVRQAPCVESPLDDAPGDGVPLGELADGEPSALGVALDAEGQFPGGAGVVLCSYWPGPGEECTAPEVLLAAAGEDCKAAQSWLAEPFPGSGNKTVQVAGLEVVGFGEAADIRIGSLSELRADSHRERSETSVGVVHYALDDYRPPAESWAE